MTSVNKYFPSTLLILTGMTVLSIIHGSKTPFMKVTNTFTDGSNFTKILYRKLSSGDYIYLSGYNVIHQLRTDLTVHASHVTGPKNMSLFCVSSPCVITECPNINKDKMPPGYRSNYCGPRLTDAYVKAWTTDDVYLYVCYNVFHGSCERLRLDDINAPVFDGETGNIPIIGSGRNTHAAIVVTKDYVVIGIEKDRYEDITLARLPSMSIRNHDFTPLKKADGSMDGQMGLGSLRFSDEAIEYYIHYKYAFRHVSQLPRSGRGKGYLYFLVVQKESTQTTRWHTRIVRLCEDDIRFYSLVEITLRCYSQEVQEVPKDYNLLQSASIGRVGKDLAARLSIEPEEDVLFASFSSQLSREKQPVPAQDAAVCLYPMSQVERVFDLVVRNCLSGKGEKGPAHYMNTFIKSSCISDSFELRKQNTAGYCPINNQPLNWPIMGSTKAETLPAQPFIKMSGQTVNTLAVTPTSSNFTVILLGGSDGKMHKYEIFDRTSGRLLDQIKISSFPLRDVKVDPTGLSAFVTAPDKLSRVQLQSCSRFEDCEACLSARDPYCGWCVAKGRCEVRDNCHRNTWLSYTSTPKKCPRIGAITPPGVQYDAAKLQTSWSLSLRIDNVEADLLRAGSTSLSCLYRRNSGHPDFVIGVLGSDIINRTQAGLEANYMVTCQTPKLMHLPKIPHGSDHVGVNLIVQLRNRNLAAGIFSVYDCSQYRDCHRCASSTFSCAWCISEHRCLEKSLSERNCKADFVIQPRNPRECPRFKRSPARITVAAGSDAHFELKVFNHKSIMAKFHCQESCRGSWVPAKYFETNQTIQCAFSRVSPGGSPPLRNCTVSVVWLGRDDRRRALVNEDNVYFEVFNCTGITQHCDDCLMLPKRYKCGWCGVSKTCTRSTFCTVNWHGRDAICPDPIIEEVTPRNSTVNGEAILTIRGRNLGRKAGDIQGNIFVEASKRVPCYYIPNSYVPARSFKCRLARTDVEPPKKCSVRVGIGQYYQALFSDFTFLKPLATGVTPLRGPRDGGTLVRIEGINLDIGTQRSAYWADPSGEKMRCRIVRETPTAVWCRSEGLPKKADKYGGGAQRKKREVGSQEPPVSAVLMMQHDATQNTFDKVHYNYAPNPQVTNVPRESVMLSGGNAVTVKGINFDIIQEPKIVFYYNNKEFVQNCKRNNATDLQCWSPPLNGSVDVTPSLAKGVLKLNVDFGFIMDDVAGVRRYGVMKVYADPLVFPFKDGIQVEHLKAQPFINFNRRSGNSSEAPLEIQLKGSFPRDGVTRRDIEVTLGDRVCTDTTLSGDIVLCYLAAPIPDRDTDYEVVVRVGRWLIFKPGVVVFKSPGFLATGLNIWLPVVGAILLLLIVAVVSFIILYCRKSREKNKLEEKMQVELMQLESKVATECKAAFTELQTDMFSFTQDLAINRLELPYHEYPIFCLAFLFPDMPTRNHPILCNFKVKIEQKEAIENGLRLLSELMSNKTFLLHMIRAMEECPTFGPRDKVKVGSLLSAALQGKMDYFTDVLKTLLIELIQRNKNENKNRLLMRRTESVAEKMLANWFAFLLHYFLEERVGEPLYLLYYAILQQVQKGPVDAITGDAKYALHEDKLIRHQIDFKEINLNVIRENEERLTVRVLDCDTITQVKQKILDTIYKNAPYSTRLQAEDIDLELITDYESNNHDYKTALLHNQSVILQDRNYHSILDGEYRKLDTLQFYKVPNGASVRLTNKMSTLTQTQTLDGNFNNRSFNDHFGNSLRSESMSSRLQLVPSPRHAPSILSVTSRGQMTLPGQIQTAPPIKEYHLVKQHDDTAGREDSTLGRGNGSLNKRRRRGVGGTSGAKLATEVYLNRLLSTKQLLHSYIDKLLEAIFSTAYHGTNLPMCVKYMFDFLDDQALTHGIPGSDVVHAWKSNSLPLRFWVQVVKNPDCVFDVPKHTAVDACLSVIAQTLMDSCSLDENKLTRDSPSSRLLFARDIKGYKERVTKYYQDIRRMPAISDQEMNALLTGHSRRHMDVFNVSRALADLYSLYLEEHKDRIMQKLRDDPNAVKLKLDQKLHQVYQHMARYVPTSDC